jgi:hypothetical protein
MMIVASNWPPYTPAEVPPMLADDLKSILEPLYVATLELHRTVYRYELLAALGRNWDFVQRINGTTAAPPLNTIKGCINTAIVVSLCAFFDEAVSGVNLKTVLNCVLRPEYAMGFRQFHAATNPGFDVDRQLARLRRMHGGFGAGTPAVLSSARATSATRWWPISTCGPSLRRVIRSWRTWVRRSPGLQISWCLSCAW